MNRTLKVADITAFSSLNHHGLSILRVSKLVRLEAIAVFYAVATFVIHQPPSGWDGYQKTVRQLSHSTYLRMRNILMVFDFDKLKTPTYYPYLSADDEGSVMQECYDDGVLYDNYHTYQLFVERFTTSDILNGTMSIQFTNCVASCADSKFASLPYNIMSESFCNDIGQLTGFETVIVEFTSPQHCHAKPSPQHSSLKPTSRSWASMFSRGQCDKPWSHLRSYNFFLTVLNDQFLNALGDAFRSTLGPFVVKDSKDMHGCNYSRYLTFHPQKHQANMTKASTSM